MPNDTLLETSNGENYRIAVWSPDPSEPGSLRILEDQRPVFTVSLGEISANTLHVHQKLLPTPETRDLTLTAVEEEFVYPDQRK